MITLLFLKKNRFSQISYKKFIREHSLLFFHAKRDALWKNKPGDRRALFFKYKDIVYNLCPEFLDYEILEIDYGKFLNSFNFKIILKFPFFTASENKFYSISNPIAKERPTGLPVLRGSSLKGALRQTAIDVLESKMLESNYGSKLEDYASKEEDEIIKQEGKQDKFWFKKKSQNCKTFWK